MKNKNHALDLAIIFNNWIAECTFTRSHHTIKSFEITIASFLSFLEQQKEIEASTFVSEEVLNRTVVLEWLEWLTKEKGCSPQTCNVRLANLRSFIKYAAASNPKYRSIYIDLQTIEQRKAERHKVEGMSKKAIKAILSIPDTNTSTGLRDAVMLSLLYTTATRLEELSNIKLGDLNLDVEYPYVVVRGKGNKFRTLYLPKQMVALLRSYITTTFETDDKQEEYLFFSKIKGNSYPITEVGISKRLKLYGEKARVKCAEVPVNLHAHQFRHARATHWLDDGLNIAQVSRLLGHENIATTMIYLDITEEIKSKAIKSRMNKEIKGIKPKWKENEVKSLLKIFGLKQ